MSGLDLGQYKHLVVTPTLAAMGARFAAPWAINLLAGTAFVESGLVWEEQIGGGPARGLEQMEPATHDDIWATFLRFQPDLAAIAASMLLPCAGFTRVQNLVLSGAYAVCMSRIKYWRCSFTPPAANDAAGLSAIHKTYYNTAAGAADVVRNIALFAQAIAA